LTKWLAGEKVHVVAPKTPGKTSKKVYVLATLLLMVLLGGLAYLGYVSTRQSIQPTLDMAKKLMAEENFGDAVVQYRVAMAMDPNNMEAVLGLKAAQDGVAKREREREERMKAAVIEKFREAEDKTLKAAELARKMKEAASDEERQ